MDMRQTAEPSVEEILESIKKVIARDNRADAAKERIRRDGAPTTVAAPRTAARAEARNDVKAIPHPADILDLSEVAAHVLGEDRGFDARAQRAYAELDSEGDESVDDEDDAPLLPEATTASMRDSLAALAMLSVPGAAPQIVRSGETSLEGLVRELLRPQLAEWLDRNLPPMVEKLVATEIARIVGKKG
jgi:uncharacterized protein